MAKRTSFNSKAAPAQVGEERPNLLGVMNEWQRLADEIFENPATSLPLDAQEMIFKNERVQAQVAEENARRQQAQDKIKAVLERVSLDDYGAAAQAALKCLAHGGKVSAKHTRVIAEGESALFEAFGLMREESARRKTSGQELRDSVQEQYAAWLKGGMALESKAAVTAPLRFKTPAQP